MKTLNELFRNNDEMPEEAFEELRKGFIRPLEDELVGRRLLPVRRLSRSTQVFSYDRIKTEPGPATIIAKGAVYPFDEYDIERIQIPIPKFGWAFQIPMEDWEAGIIQNEQTNWARRRMAEKEDSLIFNGDADFNIGGLLDFVGNTNSATANWSTATVTEIYDDVRDLITLFLADVVQGPYSMVLNPDQWSDLSKFDTTAQRTALQLVSTLVGKILVSYTIPTGTVLMMRPGPEVAQLGMKEDITITRPRFDEDTEVWKGKARAQLIPVIYQQGTVANQNVAIGTITSA